MKRILHLAILFLIILTNQISAKNLPPGSGVSIPANILILLDRTFSMNHPAKAGAGSDSMKEPRAVVQDPITGNYFVAETDNGGISMWDASTPTTNEVHSYGKISKVWRSCSPNTGGDGGYEDNTWGMEVFGQYIYTSHSKVGAPSWGYLKQFDARVNEFLATGDRCRKQVQSYNRSGRLVIDIQDGIWYALDGSTSTGFLWIRDLNADPILTTSPNICSVYLSGHLRTISDSATAMTADSSRSYLYVQNDLDQKIYSFKIRATDGCVEHSYTDAFNNPCGSSYGLVTDPLDPTVLYTSGTYTHKICKIKTNNGRFISTLAEVGIADAFESSTSTNIYFLEPWGLSFNNAGELLVANRGRLEVTILTKDLDFVRVFGLSGVSRLRGAFEAIKTVVSDSSLTEGAHFGFGLWSKEETTEYSSWNAAGRGGEGVGVPCNDKNCLVVKIDADGARKIHDYLQRPISLFRATRATAFSRLAHQYFHSGDSPVNTALGCQTNYVIVIGDGAWSTGTHNDAKRTMRNLATGTLKVKSVMVAYGDSVTGHAATKFDDMNSVGESPYAATGAIKALTAEDLKTELQTLISTIISENLSYTAPAITGSIEDSGTLFQAQFDYYAKQEWQGSLKRMKIKDTGGGVEDVPAWQAEDVMPDSDKRHIWTALEGTSGKDNFKDNIASLIHSKLFQATGNAVRDYHNESGSIIGTGRCGPRPGGKNTAGVEDGILDDIKGLINFTRGEDYFDYDGDCNIKEERASRLADIYNSQIVMVDEPGAEIAWINNNQESFYRKNNKYEDFINDNKGRQKVIYAGANNGILHAFNADTGVELWGFVPPLIVGKLPTQISPGLNKSTGGGSVPIFGVDGSPVIHDMHFQSPFDTGKKWHTILMVPYGRGGAGFSVLDVTDPDKPLHLYSILNDPNRGKVYRADHTGKIHPYDYKSSSYNLNNFEEIKLVATNYQNNPSISDTCNNVGNTSCYTGNTVTIRNAITLQSSSDVKVFVDGADVTSSSSYTQSTSKTITVTLPANMTYSSNPTSLHRSSTVNVTIINGMPTNGAEYDYRYMAETWSNPRIFRMPNDGPGDANQDDDIYVAVMGGGYGVKVAGLGSNVLVINLENGKLIKQIDIEDLPGNNIPNSVPTTPIVLTPDLSLKANYRGALVYVNDLEGKITKINLTNMEDDRAETGSPTPISLYQTTTLFSAESTADNNRYMYHGMEATIGGTTKDLWLFAGTGDYLNLNDAGIPSPNNVDNLLMGIKDRDYPKFKPLSTLSISDLSNCKDTTDDISGANCPQTADIGWYIKLEPDTTSERRKVTAEPTIHNGIVYYPIYKPSSTSLCALGHAYVCAADDECGTNFSSQLGTNPTEHDTEKCLNVGTGALSKIVVFGGDLYANIAGETNDKKDLLVIDSLSGNINSLRLNWKESF